MVASFALIRRPSYYTRAGAADYYQAGADKGGVWLRGNDRLGVERDTPVDANQFELLCEGRGPDGKALVKGAGPNGRRVAGVDVTLSSPKAVSVLWAIGGESLRAAIATAEADAVEATLQLIEREIPLARRGRNGGRRQFAVFVASVFTHSESRPERHADGSIMPSPQRHHHLCLPSIVERPDSTWGAIDTVWVRSWKKTLGAHYRLALATALQERGFAIEWVGDDWRWSIGGVPEDVRTFFSPRTATIEQELAKVGTTSKASPALAAAITLRTRREKASGGDLTTQWRDAIQRLGYEPEAIVNAAKSAGRKSNLALTTTQKSQLVRARLEPVANNLVRNQATFERRHLLEAIANALVGTKAKPEQIYKESEQLIARQTILTLGETRDGPVHSTPEMVAIERGLVATTARLAAERVPGPDPELVAQLATEFRLSEEQAAIVRAATSGARLVAVQGIAGSGKSTALRVIAKAWETAPNSPRRVIAASVAWKAANALRDEIGAPSRAIDSWLAKAEAGQRVFGSRTVLLVDEAALQSSPQAYRLLKQIERIGGPGTGPVVILVGDERQLRPIGPGHAMRLIREAVGTANLERIIRQRSPWARDMVHAFARGDAKAGLDALTERGLLTFHDGPKATVQALVAEWAERAPEKGSSVALIARTNGEVRAINAAARRHLKERGVVGEREVELPAVDASRNKFTLRLAAGDRIRFLERNDRLGVINGTEGVVKKIAAQSRKKSARIIARVQDREINFLASEVADPKGRVKLAHAYAVTLFQAQGLTVDTALVLASTQFDRHCAYVSASRARHEVRFYLDFRQSDAALAEIEHEPSEAERDQARVHYLAKQFARESIKTTTLDAFNMLAAHELGRQRERIRRQELSHEL